MQRYKAEWQLIDYCQPVPVHYQDPTPIPMYPYAPRVLYVGTSLSAGSTFDKATALERHLMDYFQRDAIDRSFVQGTSRDGSVRGCFPEDHGAYHTYHAICFLGCNNLSDILGGCEPEHITNMLHSLRTRLMPLDQVAPCICFIETNAWHLANQGASHPADPSAVRPITAGSSVSYVTPEHYRMQMLRLPGCDRPSGYERFASELLRLNTLVPAILYSVNGCAYLGPLGKSQHIAETPVPPEYKNLCFAKSHYYNLSQLPWSSDIWGSKELETASRWRHQLGECPHGANMENHNQSKMLSHLNIVSAMVDRQAGEIKLVGKRHHLGTDADELISLVELVRPGHIESYFLLREEAGRMIGKAELDEIAGSLELPIIYSSSRRDEPLGADEGDIPRTEIPAHGPHRWSPDGRSATPPIVSLEGSPGAGKTTLLRSLKQMFSGDRSIVFVEEPVDEWVSKGFLSRLYTDPTTGPAFQAMVLTCMVCDLLKALSLEPTPRLIIMERSPQGNLNVFAKANLGKADLEMIQVTFDRLMTILPVDMQITYLYLRATKWTLLKRINERNRHAEANMPSAYIALLGALQDEWLKSRCAGRPRTYVLDANADARTVFAHVCQLPIFAYDHQANPIDDGPPLGSPGHLTPVLAPAFVLPPGVTFYFPYSSLPPTPPPPWSISSCYPPTDHRYRPRECGYRHWVDEANQVHVIYGPGTPLPLPPSYRHVHTMSAAEADSIAAASEAGRRASSHAREQTASAGEGNPTSHKGPAIPPPISPLAMEGNDRVVLDQRRVETVGFSHESSRFYAIGVTKRPRIVFGTWAEVSPLTTGPALHGVTAVKRFDTEVGALAHMIRQGFLLPQYMLNGEHPAMPANAELGAGVLATAKSAPSTGAPRRLDLPDLVDLLYENEWPIAEMEEDCRDVVCSVAFAPP